VIRDKDGIPDRVREAQAYFTLGAAHFEKAKETGQIRNCRFAQHAYEKARKIALEINRPGLIYQLDGAIQSILEHFPGFDGKTEDCFQSENVDYRDRYTKLWEIFAGLQKKEKDSVIFDVE
jgi:hypothetical protein